MSRIITKTGDILSLLYFLAACCEFIAGTLSHNGGSQAEIEQHVVYLLVSAIAMKTVLGKPNA